MNKEQEILLAELLVKVAALERLLINTNIISAESLVSEMTKVSEEVLILLKNQKND